MAKTALIAGASGLVGNTLLHLLLKKEYYKKIIVLTRRKLSLEHKRVEYVIVENFDHLENYAGQMDAHDFFVTLGTTRKKAGSKEAFLKVDIEYPLAIARIAMQQPSFGQFLIVSAYGANAGSPIFYNMAKGKLENELIKLRMSTLKIFQPSLLHGRKNEFRFWEAFGKLLSSILSFFVIGSKKQLWTIEANEVATAMYRVARKGSPGTKRYKPSMMLKIAYA